ncbi:MAG: DUF4301 family protein [Rikenellaceae bacterium]
MFNPQDKEQILAHSLELAQVEKQLENFKNGFSFLSIDRAAVVGDGIVASQMKQVVELAEEFEALATGKKLVKFVPASGAATRMFKALFEFLGSGESNKQSKMVVENIEKFAFYEDVKDKVGDDKELINAIIGEDGLDYGNKPKALIKFHKYVNASRTAAEEHLLEGAMYAATESDVYIHFTVSGEHLAGFKALFESVIDKYESKLGVKYHISYSSQKPSTDMIAVTPDNEPFREDDGSLLFRPAGHGALLSNLDDIDADIVFIKTIDNVMPDSLKADTVISKKYLAALALKVQAQIFEYLEKIDEGESSEEFVDTCKGFIKEVLNYTFSTENPSLADIKAVLNRPLRVCGMVKNEGEPGGGPFWAKADDGSVSLQIAESSQIAPEQMPLMSQATHFNPVDLVCAVKNYKGEKFDLSIYVDPSTGFISNKSKNGRELKAQELPGLWNGAMAKWNTIFAEVPISTFSPVKEVTDLLRVQHQ